MRKKGKNVYEVEFNNCRCHPEICNCDRWVIFKNGRRWTTIFEKEVADEIVNGLNGLNKLEELEKRK